MWMMYSMSAPRAFLRSSLSKAGSSNFVAVLSWNIKSDQREWSQWHESSLTKTLFSKQQSFIIFSWHVACKDLQTYDFRRATYPRGRLSMPQKIEAAWHIARHSVIPCNSIVPNVLNLQFPWPRHCRHVEFYFADTNLLVAMALGLWSLKVWSTMKGYCIIVGTTSHFSLHAVQSCTSDMAVEQRKLWLTCTGDTAHCRRMTNIQHTVYSSTKLYSRKTSSLQCSNAWVKQKISSANSWTSCLRMCIKSRTAGFSSIPCQDWGTKQKPSILLAKWWRSVLEAISSMPLGQDFFTLFYPLQFFWSCRAALQRIRKNCRSQDSPALLGFRSVWWALSRHSCTGNVSCSMKHAQGSNHFPSSSLQLRSECW